MIDMIKGVFWELYGFETYESIFLTIYTVVFLISELFTPAHDKAKKFCEKINKFSLIMAIATAGTIEIPGGINNSAVSILVVSAVISIPSLILPYLLPLKKSHSSHSK